MGWQKRSTGKIYDSMSGHGFIIGCRTGNIIGFKVKSKSCSVCLKANYLNIPTKEHGCRINYEGSSGGMEAQVALELCVSLHDDSDYNIFVEYIVSDDDSTMRAHLQYDGKGKLPIHIPIPIFLADPSHRVKVMSSPIFKLAQGETKDPRQCKKIDALRIKKYIGCYIYQNRNLPISQMIKKAKAPVEHLFNCHEWCDPEWCWAKQLDAKQQELTTRIMEKNQLELTQSSSDSDSDESDWETASDSSTLCPPLSTNYESNDDDDDGDSDWESIPSSDSDDEIEVQDVGLDEEETKECAYFLKYEETYDVDESIFTPADLEEMKNRERVMMERNDRGYYRCKVKDKKLYDEIMGVYSRFITRDMLEQLNHKWSTQKNEAMNTSVFSLAPKHKHYSRTDLYSLRAVLRALVKFSDSPQSGLRYTKRTKPISTPTSSLYFLCATREN